MRLWVRLPPDPPISLTFPMTRKNTNKILDLLDQGVIDSNKLARDLLGYLSEDDVTDFCHKNDLDFDESEEDSEKDSIWDSNLA